MPELAPEPDATRPVHISSAVVRTLPERMDEVARRIAQLPDTEVHCAERGRIVVVLEGTDNGSLGARLAEMALLDGVISANMVYEQIETLQSLGEAP